MNVPLVVCHILTYFSWQLTNQRYYFMCSECFCVCFHIACSTISPHNTPQEASRSLLHLHSSEQARTRLTGSFSPLCTEKCASNVSDQPGTQSGFIISYLLGVANVQRAIGRRSTYTSNRQWRVGVGVCVCGGGCIRWWLRSQRQAGTKAGTETGGGIVSAFRSQCLRGWEKCLGARSSLLWCEMIAFYVALRIQNPWPCAWFCYHTVSQA